MYETRNETNRRPVTCARSAFRQAAVVPGSASCPRSDVRLLLVILRGELTWARIGNDRPSAQVLRRNDARFALGRARWARSPRGSRSGRAKDQASLSLGLIFLPWELHA